MQQAVGTDSLAKILQNIRIIKSKGLSHQMAHLESWVRSCLNAERTERATVVAMVRLKFGYPTAREVSDIRAKTEFTYIALQTTLLQNKLFLISTYEEISATISSRWEEQSLNIQLHPPSSIHKLVLPHSRRETGTSFPRLSEWCQATCIYHTYLHTYVLSLSWLERRCMAHDRSWMSRLSTCPSITPVIKRVRTFSATSPVSKIGERRLMTKSKNNLRSSLANIWAFSCSSPVDLLVWGSHGTCGISSNELPSFAQHFIPHRTITRNYILLTFQEVWSTLGAVSC